MGRRPVLKNYSGTYQLKIEDAEDLKAILDLEEARWVATSAPTDGLNCDPEFLKHIDTDENGRVRTDELRTAISWMFEMLTDTSGLGVDSNSLPMASIDTSKEAGKKLRAGAERILSNIGKPDAGEIRLCDVRDRQKILSDAAANGDGVIPPNACDEAEVESFMHDILDTVGGKGDASGEPGIGAEELEYFMREAKGFLEWSAAGKKEKSVMVWGEDTPDAFAALSAVDEKIDEYFALSELIRFNQNLQSVMDLKESDIDELDSSNVEAMKARVGRAPLARIGDSGALDLGDGVNPCYTVAVAGLREKVVARAVGDGKVLQRDEWEQVKALFRPYREWVSSKKGEAVEKLGEDKLREYVDGDYSKKVRALVDADAAVAGEVAEVATIEKLILYRKYLIELANNVVSMPRLYDPEVRSLFQMGSLVMDGRQFDFNVKVSDRATHKKIAQLGEVFLMYVEITGRETDKKFEVATPVTAGDAGNLAEGKRGIFFTTDGREWDARVAEIIRKPVSLWEAVKAPFVSLGSSVEKQIEKMTRARFSDLDAKITKGMQQQASKAPAKAVQPAASGTMRDVLLGGGLAFAAVGSALAFITKTLSDIGSVWKVVAWVLAVVVGGALAILIPVFVLAVLRLRRRDLAAILEASGWAVNARLRIRKGLGSLFTFEPDFPADAVSRRANLVRRLARKVGKRTSLLAWCIRFAVAAVLGAGLGYVISRWTVLVIGYRGTLG